MRNAIIFILFSLSVRCTPINTLAPNQTDTFLKFYGESNEMNAKDIAVLSDGYLLLSTYSELSTELLKTDLQGNKLWAKSFDNFQGSSLAVINDGYILIGDHINNQKDSTYMHLIKTNLEGNNPVTTELGSGIEHGVAVTQTSNGDIIALGFTTPAKNNTHITIIGYKSDLDSSWTQRDYPVIGLDQYPSKSVHESDNGNITWLSSVVNGANIDLKLTEIVPNSDSPELNEPLFINETLSSLNGDLVKTTDGGFAIVTTLIVENQTQIGFSSFIGGIASNENAIALGKGNQNASSIENATNGLLITGTTDFHGDGSARTDKDLLLIETNYNGTLKTNGINITYGGVGDEVPVRIRKTNDGGFAILGTLTNSKGAQQTFLLKTNSKGKLD